MDPFDMKPARDLGMSSGERVKSLDRESGMASSVGHLAWWTFVRGYMAVWHRLTIHNRERIPKKPPFVLVANHASHLDALVLAAPLPWKQRDKIFPIAAGDVFFETPMVSAFAAYMLNALPMWRKKCGPHALEQLRRKLVEDPCAYILFPEGARSRDGAMLPFKPGLGMLIAGTDVPVVPCHLQGCYDALPADCKIPRPRRITVRIGEPVAFGEVKNNREGWKHIASELQSRVKSLDPNCQLTSSIEKS
jgi:1-acyl-sn-glycerol-3-phosphate acyltransferase